MAHAAQRDFCLRVKKNFPDFFYGKNVLDVGSLDVNGTNRDLFDNCTYTGIDVASGKNVDLVCCAHEHKSTKYYDTIVSTECFEHDMFYKDSLKNIISLLSPGGLFLFTCATTGRAEHGTRRSHPEAAPLLSGTWSDYYKNLEEKDIRDAINVDEVFISYSFEVNSVPLDDLYFFGIKRG